MQLTEWHVCRFLYTCKYSLRSKTQAFEARVRFYTLKTGVKKVFVIMAIHTVIHIDSIKHKDTRANVGEKPRRKDSEKIKDREKVK